MSYLCNLGRIYLRQRIPGLWKFSRKAAGKSSVNMGRILPPNHYLRTLQLDFSNASARDIRNFLRRSVRLSNEMAPFDSANSFLQVLSGIFGIDKANDIERVEITRKQILPILVNNKIILDKVMELLSRYYAWPASGEHRLMPIAAAIINLFNGRNIFDPQAAQDLRAAHPMFKFLTEVYPLYANPHNLPQRYIPDLPHLQLPTLAKRKIKFLDIATAPKQDGSPTLNMLKRAFYLCLGETEVEFYGTDISMPYFEITESGEVILSKYVDPRTGDFREKTVHDGIKYFHAAVPKYDARSDEFFKGERFDFISICMALHHLGVKGETAVSLPFSSLRLTDQNGRTINNNLNLFMPPSVQKVVDRMLTKLNIGGALFINPWFLGQYMHQNSDMFFVIRRTGENNFVIYDELPIPFSVKDQAIMPSENRKWLAGISETDHITCFIKKHGHAHPGIVATYPDRSPEFYRLIEQLLHRADLLAFRYQRWNKGLWSNVTQTIQAIRDQKSISEILEIYLSNVPDSSPLKIELLRDARKLI